MILKIPIYGYYYIRFFISIEDTYSELFNFLESEGLPDFEIIDYVEKGKKRYINGRTKFFSNYNLLLVKLNNFSDNIRSIAILSHELNHASRRIIETEKVRDKEESECYMQEYLFEEIMCILKPRLDYNKKPRNLDWFYEITH